tara:strand:- start:38404 stop:39450 length:1047 start_codon:yes stop_codon:yes gene_type:complete
MIIKEKKALKFCYLFLKKIGLDNSKSKIISSHLVKSDMSGHFSHGINRLIQYYNAVKKGVIKIKSTPKLISSKNNFIRIDGNFSFGQLSMNYVCKLIIKSKHDITVTSLYNAGHIGRLSDYNEMLAKKNLISLIFCNGGGPNTSIYPSKSRITGTNPFAFGMPIKKKKNLIIDFATSKLAEGKVNLASLNNSKLKNFPIINKKGLYTNNPREFYRGGTLMPFGEIKGSSFLLVNEILGGILISNNNSINKNYIDGNNCLIITIKKNIFSYNKKDFLKQFLILENKIKKSKKIKNYNLKKTYLPGDIEKEKFLKSKKNGINYNKALLKRLNDLATDKLNFNSTQLIKSK